MQPLANSRSVALHQKAEQVLAMGVSSGMRRRATPIPLYFERGAGPYFYTADGRKLLDYTLGWGPLIVGNNHPRLNAAIAAQLARSYTFGAQQELELQVATAMTKAVPGLEQVIFSNTGSEAVQAAIRLARATTGRPLVIKFEGHYHGWMNNVLVSYHPTGGAANQAQPACGGQPEPEYSQTLVLPWNELAALETALEAYRGQVAGVITEPLLANSGCCEPAPGYLEGVLKLCREHGAVSIFDEVITGFRLALGGAREYYGLTPDLSVYGKALGGGFSFAAVGGRAEMFDCLRDGHTIHAGTYNGNSICLAAAQATLEILSEPGVYDAMNQHGQRLRDTLQSAASECDLELLTTGAGTVFSLHFSLSAPPRNYRETLSASAELRQQFQLAMLEAGVYLLPDGRWYVGATHDAAALDLASTAIRSSFSTIASF